MRHRVTVVGCVCVCVCGYVCVCLCVCVWFNFSNRSYVSPQRCSHLIYNEFFHKTAFSQNSLFAELWNSSGSHIGAFVGHLACSHRHPSPLHSRDVIYSRLHGVFVTGFAIVFGTTLYSARACLHHWTLNSTTCTRSPEGRYDPI